MAEERRTDARHAPTGQIEVVCAPLRRNRFKRNRGTVTATVLEVSANGMLIDMPLELKVEPGDMITISAGEAREAVARVVHTVRDENWTNQWAGVELTEMSPDFAESHNLLVTSLGVEYLLDPS